MFLLTNLSRRTIKIDGVEIERNKTHEISNEKWEVVKLVVEIRDLLIAGKLTAEKIKK